MCAWHPLFIYLLIGLMAAGLCLACGATPDTTEEDNGDSGDDTFGDDDGAEGSDDDDAAGDDDDADDDDAADDDDTAGDDDDDPPEVMILDDGMTGADLVEILEDFGTNAAIWGLESEYDGSPIEADVIILVDGGALVWGVDMPEAGQQALLDFQAAGGSLLVTEWVLWDHAQLGQYDLLAASLPATVSNEWGTEAETFFVEIPSHPIAQDLPGEFSLESISFSHATATRGDVVISGTQSGHAVVADASGAGRICYCAFAGVSDGLDGKLDLWSEPMRLLIRNIVDWLQE